MKWLLTASGVLLALVLPATVKAQQAQPDRIAVSYEPPTNPAHQPIYDQLKEAQFLEKLKEFLSPFRLPKTLMIKTAGCDGEVTASYDEAVITLCYEYVDEIWKTAPTETTPSGVLPIDALVAPVFDTCLHEFGHALFDMLKLPVFGREEDAADQVAAYLALQLGKEEARRQIGGVAYAYLTEAKAATAPTTLEQFANEHGTPAQRLYNVLCIAYGADPVTFGDLVTKGLLPKSRAESCDDEYEQVAFAFETLIKPHIDQKMAKKVMDTSWLPDPKTPLRRHPGARRTP